MKNQPSLAAVAALLATLSVLPACAPLIVGGAAVGGAMFAVDRRSSGAQVEDQAIEVKAASRVRELAALGNVTVTSYNRIVMLSGEVPAEAQRVAAEQVVAQVENVRSVINELAIAPNSSLGTGSNDAILSAKVKAAFVDARDLQANAIKVVTERGIVYLMGIVSEREATRAAEMARSVGGVQKVVRVFEVVSEAELARLTPQATPK